MPAHEENGHAVRLSEVSRAFVRIMASKENNGGTLHPMAARCCLWPNLRTPKHDELIVVVRVLAGDKKDMLVLVSQECYDSQLKSRADLKALTADEAKEHFLGMLAAAGISAEPEPEQKPVKKTHQRELARV